MSSQNLNVTYPTSNARAGQTAAPAFTVLPPQPGQARPPPGYNLAQTQAGILARQQAPPPAPVQPPPPPAAPARFVRAQAPSPEARAAQPAQPAFVSGEYKCFHPDCVAGGLSTVLCGSAHAWKEHMRVRHGVNV